MRIDTLDAHHVSITLSERNLRALLAKLDGHPDASARTITRSQQEGASGAYDWLTLWVTAEHDAVHYVDREPGPMHPATENEIRANNIIERDKNRGGIWEGGGLR